MKLCDFGISAEATSMFARTSRYSRGTSCYRAPELLRLPATYTNKADMWAFGCIFYELSTSRKAFDGDWAVQTYDRAKDAIIPYEPHGWVNDYWRNIATQITAELLSRESSSRPRAATVQKLLSSILEQFQEDGFLFEMYHQSIELHEGADAKDKEFWAKFLGIHPPSTLYVYALEVDQTPFPITVEQKYEPLVRAMSAMGYEAWQVFSAAVEAGRESRVRMLLPIVQWDHRVFRILVQVAAGNGHVEVVKLLLQAGKKIPSQDYLSALTAARKRGHHDVVQLLLTGGLSSIGREAVYIVLQHFCSEGDVEMVQILLDRGANVNVFIVEARDGRLGPLYEAARSGQEEVVRLLLERGANVNLPGSHNTRALHGACMNGNPTIVKMLLDKGADIDAERWPGRGDVSALEIAVNYGYEQIVKTLLDRGAKVKMEAKFYVIGAGFKISKESVSAIRAALVRHGASDIVEDYVFRYSFLLV